jgi:hypothetical protein
MDITFDLRHVVGGWSGRPRMISISLPETGLAKVGTFRSRRDKESSVVLESGGRFYVPARLSGQEVDKNSMGLFGDVSLLVKSVVEKTRADETRSDTEIGTIVSGILQEDGRLVYGAGSICRTVQGGCWSLRSSYKEWSAGFFLEDSFERGMNWTTMASVHPANDEHREILSRHAFREEGAVDMPPMPDDLPVEMWSRAFDPRHVLAVRILEEVVSKITSNTLRPNNIETVTEMARCMRHAVNVRTGAATAVEDACDYIAWMGTSELMGGFRTPDETRTMATRIVILSELAAATPDHTPRTNDEDSAAYSTGI